MTHFVIMGAGIAGTSAAFGLRQALGKTHQITVINPVDYFQFVPSNVWAGIGTRTRKAITLPLKPYLEKRSIGFIPHAVKKIEAKNNRLVLTNEEEISYDYLIIASGPKLAFHEVPGSGPAQGHTLSICTIDHAEKTEKAYKKLLQNPGPIIIGAMPGASCFGPAYEYAFIVHHDLVKRGIRDKFSIKFVTSEPYIGHLGLMGVNKSREMLEDELKNANIEWITNAKVTEVKEKEMLVSELNKDGKVIKEHQLPFHFSMMIPAFTGVDPVMEVDGLCNPKGFILTDEFMRSKQFPNIYSAGVCTALAPAETTAVATGMPKTGYMIETMVAAIIQNIEAELKGKAPFAKPSMSAICLADMGNRGFAFIAKPQFPPRSMDWAKEGKWVHLAKIAFEKYFLYKIKRGISEPFYEKYFLKLFDIHRIKK